MVCCIEGMRLNVSKIISILFASGIVTSSAMAQTSAEQYWQQGNQAMLDVRYDDAIASYTMAIRLRPDFARAYGNRGAAYLMKGLYDNAIADLNKAIDLDPTNDTPYENRGHAYRRKNLYNQALADYDKALFLNPKNASTREWRDEVLRLIQKSMSKANLFSRKAASKADSKWRRHPGISEEFTRLIIPSASGSFLCYEQHSVPSFVFSHLTLR
jgi:tetratricopeptide (TPR) repeat protein